jgi:hypothetical protein
MEINTTVNPEDVDVIYISEVEGEYALYAVTADGKNRLALANPDSGNTPEDGCYIGLTDVETIDLSYWEGVEIVR